MTHGKQQQQRDKYAEVARTLGGRVLAVDAINVADNNGLDPARLLRAVADYAKLADPSG